MTDRAWALWASWVRMATLGEALGFLVPAVVGASSAQSPWAMPAIVAAGAVEGLALGSSQWLVLHRVVPDLRFARWVAATAAGASIAYVLGMLPSATSGIWNSWPSSGRAIGATVVIAGVLGSIGFAQWTVLRSVAVRSLSWIWWTAAGWVCGVGVFFAIAPPLWHEGQAMSVTVAIGVLAGVGMAVTAAAITGVGVVRLSGRKIPSSTSATVWRG